MLSSKCNSYPLSIKTIILNVFMSAMILIIRGSSSVDNSCLIDSSLIIF